MRVRSVLRARLLPPMRVLVESVSSQGDSVQNPAGVDHLHREFARRSRQFSPFLIQSARMKNDGIEKARAVEEGIGPEQPKAECPGGKAVTLARLSSHTFGCQRYNSEIVGILFDIHLVPVSDEPWNEIVIDRNIRNALALSDKRTVKKIRMMAEDAKKHSVIIR